MNLDALVLAGKKKNGLLEEQFNIPTKALIPLHGKPMILYVIDALRDVGDIKNILVIGPVKPISEKMPYKNIEIIPDGDGIIDNLDIGFSKLHSTLSDFVLIITSDIPLITSEIIKHFIDTAFKYDADIYYPIIRKEICEKKFPQIKRTYGTVKEGVFTGGNIFLIRKNAFADVKNILEKAIAYRKKPWKLSKLLGFKFLLKFFMKQNTIAEVEKRAYELIGHKGKAIELPFPEAGIDVDKESDYLLAKDIL